MDSHYPTLTILEPRPMIALPLADSDAAPTRIMALHALAYCERLFYLEEVEEIRVADDRVFAGRELHAGLADADSDAERVNLELSSSTLGLFGKVDCLSRRDGAYIPYEHKRGQPRREVLDETDGSTAHQAWPSDRLQVIAYAVLLEEAFAQPIPEGRIHYHAANVTVRVPIDEQARADLHSAIARARQLRQSTERPPVTDNERLCQHCSLAPVCLPEHGRKKAIALFESRLQESWKHPVLNYSLSYSRTIELEARLLEKEWTGEPGLFARARLR
jgi:CRISP-associated protein Cas1